MKRQWTNDELIDEWMLTLDEEALLDARSPATRLGFAVLLKYFQHEGRFPQQRHDIPSAIVTFLARRLDVPAEAFFHYNWSGHSIKRHRMRIRAALGFRSATLDDAIALRAWLCDHVLPNDCRSERAIDAVYAQCHAWRLEPPTPDRIHRLVRSALRTFEARLYATTMQRLSLSTRAALEALLAATADDDTTHSVNEGDGGAVLPETPESPESPKRAERFDTSAAAEALEGDDEFGARAEALLDQLEARLGAAGDEDAVWRTRTADAGGSLKETSPRAPMLLSPSGTQAFRRDQTSRDRGVKPTEVLTLHELRTDPGPTGLESVLLEINKLLRLRQLNLPADLFVDLAPQVVRIYRNRAAIEAPSLLRAHAEPVRLTLLAALCWSRTQEVTDGLVALLIAVAHRMHARAERRVEREYLDDLKRVAGKTTLLYKVAEAAVEHPDGIVREVVFPIVTEKTLWELVKEYKASGPRYRQHVYLVMKASFRTYYRRMLPKLLEALNFRSSNEQHRPLIRAIDLVRTYMYSGAQFYPLEEVVPLDGIVRPMWRDLVLDHDVHGRVVVHRLHYELCALQALRDGLRSKEIWVEGAHRFGNPDEDLPANFEIERATHYAALKLPLAAEEFVDGVRRAMTSALEQLNATLPHKNKGVQILKKGSGWIQVSPFAPLPEAPNLPPLKQEIALRWPMTGLLDMLKETALRTAFTDVFTSLASREAIAPDLLCKRLLLCLYALGTNTGLKRLAGADPESTYSDLRYVRSRYIAKEQLRSAIAVVANAIFRARQVEVWGEGTSACASDSKKFGAWDQNLMTEWSIRHFGRGVMVYWHVEHKSVCVYSQLKTVSSSEVAAMIEGVLRHGTDLEIEKQYVDSHGQSEVAFAFCHLLGFQLLPRLKPIHAQRLYRPEAGYADAYPQLAPVLTRPIDWALIRQQYDQMIKYATALRLGTAEAEDILRRFTRGNRQHPTYQALCELGKAIKTIFLCQYLQSEALRREIHAALNVIENWNSANSFIFYGKSGEIATNRLDEQEVAVLCLHLLQICLVYINTLMIQEVLAERSWARRMTMADYRALSPLLYLHVNPYGRFSLDMSERLALRLAAEEG